MAPVPQQWSNGIRQDELYPSPQQKPDQSPWVPPDRRPPADDKPPTPPAKGCECDGDNKCGCDLKAIEDRIDEIANKCQPVDLTIIKNEIIAELTKVIEGKIPAIDKPTKQRHIVIVADQKASYWPRLLGEIKAAEGHYSAIKTAPPPSFSVPLPQLVVYENGIPVRRSVGLYNVSNDLAQIIRGTFPSESAGQ